MLASPSPPAVIVHCDWSIAARKRWLCSAIRQAGRWQIGAPELVGNSHDLVQRQAQLRAADGAVLFGFDFPIGLPAAYGAQTGFADFRQALAGLGHGDWAQWYAVAETPAQITPRRPFYPFRPGGTKKAHLLDALGLVAPDQLLRLCDRATTTRPAASALFWTLGANQVGKAAITGWQEIIAPNLAVAGLWPFDGSLAHLLPTHPLIFAETYPGDVYARLGMPRRPVWSKRQQGGRRAMAPHLLAWLDKSPVTASAELRQMIVDGFSASPQGEDQFDALVGLFGMLDVATGKTPEGAPGLPAIKTWEGWILGQAI